MRSNHHTLIRLSSPATSGPFYSALGTPKFGAMSTEFDPPSLSITDIEVTPDELLDLARDSSFIAAPGSFPIKAIEPQSASESPAAGGNIAWGVIEVHADVSQFDGAGVRPAVLDTGIDSSHDAFIGVNLIERDFTGGGNGDGHGHGTHCAGTIFGRDVGGTRIGVARGVTEAMIGRVLDRNGGGDSTMLFKAMAWAISSGANVISMSLGFDFPGYVEYQVNTNGLPIPMATSIALRDYTANLRAFDALMSFARSQIPFTGGSVVIAAAGNESQLPQFQISASVPAAADGVVAVGAVRAVAGQKSATEIASFSNTHAQIVAPGVDVWSAKAGGGLVAMSGTSMACPHAAGVALLWWQALASQGLPSNASSVTARLISEADARAIIGYTQVIHGNGVARAP